MKKSFGANGKLIEITVTSYYKTQQTTCGIWHDTKTVEVKRQVITGYIDGLEVINHNDLTEDEVLAKLPDVEAAIIKKASLNIEPIKTFTDKLKDNGYS